MADQIHLPPKVLSDEDTRRAATMHEVYRYLLQLAARKEAAAQGEARNRTQAAAVIASPAVRPERGGV